MNLIAVLVKKSQQKQASVAIQPSG